MTKVDRITLADIIDEHFCMLVFDSNGKRIPEERIYRNKQFRTIDLSRPSPRPHRRWKIQNLLEIKNIGVFRDLRFRFTDEHVKRVSVSRVEDHLGELRLGWADVYDGAHSLVIDVLKAKLTPFKLARWLDKNLEHSVLTLEGKRFVRLSFSHENDFILAKLRFV